MLEIAGRALLILSPIYFFPLWLNVTCRVHSDVSLKFYLSFGPGGLSFYLEEAGKWSETNKMPSLSIGSCSSSEESKEKYLVRKF